MKLALSKRLDRLRGTLGGLTGFKFAETGTGGLGLSQNGQDSVAHQQEMQIALQELRSLVLDTISLEMTLRSDPDGYSEIEPTSMDSINFALVDPRGDLLNPTIEDYFASDSVPFLLDSLTDRSLTVSVQQS